MKNKKILLIALFSLALSPLAEADVGADASQAGHDVKESTIHVAHKTGEVAEDVGHATVHAVKVVGHSVASAASKGYHATKHEVHKVTE